MGASGRRFEPDLEYLFLFYLKHTSHDTPEVTGPLSAQTRTNHDDDLAARPPFFDLRRGDPGNGKVPSDESCDLRMSDV